MYLRTTTAIPWTPDVRKVSGETCIQLGQRVLLTHNFKCGRWAWKFTKRSSTTQTTLPLKQVVTWPPGLAPEPNCDTQICCSSGSTHLPTQNITGYMQYPRPFHNTTVWYKLKSSQNSDTGIMHTMYSHDNQGLDPKKCYRTKDLEPAAYRCTHIAPHNITHIAYHDVTYNLSIPTGDHNRPRPFVWTTRREGIYCVGICSHSLKNYTDVNNCTWTAKHCFNLTTCGYHEPTQCPKQYPIPPGGLIKGNVNKTLLHDVNLVMTHVTYNISNILSAYVQHCDRNDETYTWLQARIDDLISDYKGRLAVQIPSTRTKRDLMSDVTGLFGSANSLANTYRITGQSQYSTWLANQVATGFQHLTNSNQNIIKAVKTEAQALLTAVHTIFNQTRTTRHALACRTFAQDLFTAARQEILDLRLRKPPRHALNDLIEILDLNRWLASEKMKNIHYSELLATLMMYNGNECTGCIGFFATFPLIHPEQVYPDSTTIRSLGTVVKNQVLKWDHITGYMTVRGTETLFSTRTCCHETSSYVVCTCNTLKPFSHNDTKLINVLSLHGYADAVQVSNTQWCVISEMTSFSYGGLSCPANHSFCLEITEDFSMGQINILGRVPMDIDTSPWWEDTFYEESTRVLTDTMSLVEQVIVQTDYHLNQAQVQANLAKKTAEILTSSTTRSALYAYTWWDWVFRGCVIGSALILVITIVQCCYFRHHIRMLRKDTHAALLLSKLQPSALQRL